MTEKKPGSDRALTLRQKTEKVIRRSRDHMQKTQDEARLNEVIRDNAIAIKHLQLQRSMLERRKKRIDAERAWSSRLFDGGDIARACRRVSKSDEAIKEINLRNVGSIVFGPGGFTPSGGTPEPPQALNLLAQLRNFKIRANAAGARQVTVVNNGNTIGSRSTRDRSRISLDSYLCRDDGAIRDYKPLKPILRNKTTSSLYQFSYRSKINSAQPSYTDASTVSLNALKTSPSAEKNSVIASPSLKSVDKIKFAARKNKEQHGSEPSQLLVLLNQSLGFSNRDAILIEQYLQDKEGGADANTTRDDETVSRLQKIVDTWKIKRRKLRRMRRAVGDDSDPTRFFDNESDLQFVLHLLNHLRHRDSSIALTPFAALQCRYLRLSDVNISQLEKACRAVGQEPDIHAFSKPAHYDPYVNNIFDTSSSRQTPVIERSVATNSDPHLARDLN